MGFFYLSPACYLGLDRLPAVFPSQASTVGSRMSFLSRWIAESSDAATILDWLQEQGRGVAAGSVRFGCCSLRLT
jgi:hypothetical protein